MRTVSVFRPSVAVAVVSFVVVSACSLGDPVAASTGQELYLAECAQCHGATGRGDGPVAAVLDPPPRNFHEGLYKLRSTESGELPTDDDLLRTISRGIPGSGMPSFAHLGDAKLGGLLAYIKSLGGPANETGSWFDLYEVPPAEKVPPRPEPSAELTSLGLRLYSDMGCDGCHGADGRGGGPSANDLTDNSGRKIRPRSFALGVFKGGGRPEDIYLRLLTGLDGTPMTSFWKDVLSPTERWAVVGHVQSLGRAREVKQPVPVSLRFDGSQAARSRRVGRMALSGGWLDYYPPLTVAVSRTSDDLLVELEWDEVEPACSELSVLFSSRRDFATFEPGAGSVVQRTWTWKAAAAAAASYDRAVDGGQQENGRPPVTVGACGDGHCRVSLSGDPGPMPSSFTVMIAGCRGEQRFLTSTVSVGLVGALATAELEE